ncbi:MAG: hypothetical protein K0B09_13000, partial [Bacteroidales bacterium]|nr:hypothetical protein [Bacteroidales bacterium]
MRSMYEKFPRVILVFILGAMFFTFIGEANAQAPTGAATNLSITNIDGNQFYVSYTRGNGARRIIVASENPITAIPVDGADYLADNYGLGNEIAPGQYVVYKGTAAGTWLYGFNHSTTYYIRIYEYNGTEYNTEYLTTAYLDGSVTTLFAPTLQAGNISFSNITGSGITLNWTNGNGSGRILVARADNPVEVEPQDLVNYNPWAGAFGTTSTYYSIGTPEHKVLYMGGGSGVSITNLDPDRTYHFAIFEYSGNSGKVYLRPGSTASQLTASTPTVAASNFTVNIANVDGNRFYYSFNSGNGARRVVIAKEGGPVTALPEDGISYTANTTFGSGQEISSGEFVVYNGTSNQDWIYGLQPNTTYHLAVFEYNGTGTESFYLTDVYLQGSRATLSPPTTQASGLTFSNITGTGMTVNWTNGNGSGRILVARADNPVEVEPQDLVNYNPWAGAFGSTSTYYSIGTLEHKVLYMGSGSGISISNLDPNRTYHFAVFEYTGNSGKQYLRPGSTASQLTASAPTVAASNFTVNIANVDGERFYYSFTSGNGARRLVIAKKGSPVTALPEDGFSYTANTTFGSGQEIATGEFVVLNGTSSGSWLYGLEPATTYHFAVFEYNGTGTETFYLTDPYLAGSRATLGHPTVQSSNAFTSSRSNTSINVSWTRGGGSNRILIGRKDGPVNVEPQDLATYSTSSSFGTSWAQIGTGNYALYAGSGNNVNVTNLEPGTNYYFALFEYNGSSGKLYLRPGYQFALETLGERPTVQVSNAVYSNIEFNSFDVAFTPGNGSRRLVLARQGGPVNAGPADFSTYEANSTFGSGAQIGTGNFVVYNGFGNNFHLDGLQPATTYHFAFYEYSLSEQGELYLAPAYTSVQASKAYYDLGISEIISPASGCELSDSEAITIKITNFSNATVEALQVGYSINGSEPIIESISGTNLVPGNGTKNHTFAATEDLSEKGSYEITAFLILEDDINEDNDSFTAMVVHHPEMETSISDDMTICQGESVVLTAAGGTSYHWSNNSNSASITVSPASTTQYTVTITNAAGCEKLETVTVTVNPAPVLSFAGDQGFAGSYVAPAIGSEETEFIFRVKYTDTNGNWPAEGYPRVEMDSNNNGVVTDPTDLILSMVEEDPADTDVTDGKIYVATVSGLSDQVNWKTRIHAVTTEGCVAQTAFVNAPLLSDDLLDIAIFANNITFSNGTPAVDEVIGIQARVNNLSDFPAENFVVSAYSEDVQIFTTTVGYLAPKSNVVLSWDFSFAEPGFYPIKVVIDETNVLNEINELNNFAIRPLLVGDFELPGGIEITAQAHKSTYYPGETVRISGYANYYGIEEGVNPNVAGATVTLNLQTRPSRIVNTRSNGYYEATFTAPSSPGEYLLSGQITDYTLTATIEAFDVVVIPRPPKPDLISSIQLSQSTVLQGETVSGTATVTNVGQETAHNFIFRYVSCEEVLGEQLIESLAPGQSLSFNFQASPSVVGDCFIRYNCLFNAFADFTRVVDESNENNNSANTYLTVLPDLPDLTPEKSSAPYSYTNINNTFNINVRVDNIGGVAAGGSFDVNVYADEILIESRTYEELLPCNSLSFTLAFQPTEPKDYVISVKVDEPIGSGNIAEYREGNNVYTRTVLYRPPVLNPNLNIRLRDVVITPANPAPGQTVQVDAPYRNNGNDAINDPFSIAFSLQDGENTINSSERVQGPMAVGENRTTTYSTANNGPAFLRISLDSENEIAESSESDNQILVPLCWDFTPAQTGSIWSGNFYINTNQTFSARIRNLGMYTGENVKVKFLINEVVVGEVVIPTLNSTIFTSGYFVSIPYVFSEPGQYQLKVVVDPDDDYLECNEDNNVTSRTINVLAPRADLRVLSEYISPTSINPDANEPVNVFLSFDNVGVMDAGPFNVRVTVDDVPLGEDIRVSGLRAGRLTTVAIPAPYSSPTGGVRIIRGFVDVDNEVIETILYNNEASRAIIVGDAPNLLFTAISLSNNCPGTGESITISASIKNEGKVSTQAQVHFFYIAGQDTIPIDFVNITAGADEVVNTQIDWSVVSPEYPIYAEIMNASPQEYNLLDNSIDISFCTEPVVNFVLSTQVQGQGIITTNPQQTLFAQGTQVQINATAAPGWEFSHWEGDLSGSETEENLIMDGNKLVKAVFFAEETESYLLSLVSSPEGAGTLTGDGEYEAGTEVQVSASASEGFTFVSWTLDGAEISGAANFTYTMPAEDVTLV